jgi:uncharacterized membrane protein YphA (DoxX/SURF4 family)
MSRYYPGFMAALSIVLLRIAIGWHFLYEGCEKVVGTVSGKEPFSAEIYLRNANGPLGTYFRGMLPDVNSVAMLDPARLKESWKDDVSWIADQYAFTTDQQDKAQKILDVSLRWADYWFDDPENVEKIKKYYHDLGQVLATEQDPNALSFQKERAWESRRSVEADRRTLIQPLVGQEKSLREAVAKLVLPEQVKAAGATREWILSQIDKIGINSRSLAPSQASSAPPARWTSLDVLNALTMYGLIAIGGCLILGFLTPLAALSAAAFLAMIYLSMPPWPGLPPNPKAEGHYLIVSKNLIELIACFVVATTPNAHWIGLDALFFGARRRRRLAAQAARRREQQAERRQTVHVA